MADQVRKMSYCDLSVSARAGQGAAILGALKRAGVNLLAFSGFPTAAGKAQVDLISDDIAGLKRVARAEGWQLSKPKKGFLVQGADKVGACHRQLDKLARARIRVTAAQGIAAGRGRYGMILWVKPADYARAARSLGAK
jgi:hypothetical protein